MQGLGQQLHKQVEMSLPGGASLPAAEPLPCPSREGRSLGLPAAVLGLSHRPSCPSPGTERPAPREPPPEPCTCGDTHKLQQDGVGRQAGEVAAVLFERPGELRLQDLANLGP